MRRFPGQLYLVHLSPAAQDDLRFWEALLQTFPSRLLIRRRLPANHDPLHYCRIITTDASTEWGIGGFYQQRSGENMYFSIPWNPLFTAPHSTYGELLALAVAVALWDFDWKREHVLWITDCKCHVSGLYKIRTKAPELLPLHDYLDLRAARGMYQYAPQWLRGTDNTLADELSRNILDSKVLDSMTRCHPTTALLPFQLGTTLSL